MRARRAVADAHQVAPLRLEEQARARAVAERRRRRVRAHLGQRHAGQGVGDGSTRDLGVRAGLRREGEVHEVAAPAGVDDRTRGRHAIGAGLDHTQHARRRRPLGEAHLTLDQVARRDARHEHDRSFEPADTGAAGGDALDPQRLPSGAGACFPAAWSLHFIDTR